MYGYRCDEPDSPALRRNLVVFPRFQSFPSLSQGLGTSAFPPE